MVRLGLHDRSEHMVDCDVLFSFFIYSRFVHISLVLDNIVVARLTSVPSCSYLSTSFAEDAQLSQFIAL